jgi:DNA-binding response OmpR family regulator
MKMLIVGGGADMAEKLGVAVHLRWPGAEIIVADEPDAGLKAVARDQPDLVMIQSAPNGRTDTTFIEGLRAFSDVALVVLEPAGGGGAMDEVVALEAGADDYIPESTEGICLIARLIAVVRRTRRSFDGQTHDLTNGPLSVDPSNYEVHLHGRRLAVTPTEFRLLHLLFVNRGNVMTRESIAGTMWGDEVDSTALVKKYVQRLRRTLGDTARDAQWIVNVHGVGYKLVVFKEPEAVPMDGRAPAELALAGA